MIEKENGDGLLRELDGAYNTLMNATDAYFEVKGRVESLRESLVKMENAMESESDLCFKIASEIADRIDRIDEKISRITDTLIENNMKIFLKTIGSNRNLSESGLNDLKVHTEKLEEERQRLCQKRKELTEERESYIRKGDKARQEKIRTREHRFDVVFAQCGMRQEGVEELYKDK